MSPRLSKGARAENQTRVLLGGVPVLSKLGVNSKINFEDVLTVEGL